jgi:hypothetical protein
MGSGAIDEEGASFLTFEDSNDLALSLFLLGEQQNLRPNQGVVELRQGEKALPW